MPKVNLFLSFYQIKVFRNWYFGVNLEFPVGMNIPYKSFNKDLQKSKCKYKYALYQNDWLCVVQTISYVTCTRSLCLAIKNIFVFSVFSFYNIERFDTTPTWRYWNVIQDLYFYTNTVLKKIVLRWVYTIILLVYGKCWNDNFVSTFSTYNHAYVNFKSKV